MFLLYFAYQSSLELDECIISYIYALSQHQEYLPLLKERVSFLMFLLDRQVQPEYFNTQQ